MGSIESYCQGFYDLSWFDAVAGIFQLSHKWNTGSLDPGMASLLVKINSHVDLRTLIFFPPNSPASEKYF